MVWPAVCGEYADFKERSEGQVRVLPGQQVDYKLQIADFKLKIKIK